MSEIDYSQFGSTSMLQGDSLSKAMNIAESTLPGDPSGTIDTKVPDTTPEPVQKESQITTSDPVQAPSQGNVLELAEDSLVRVKIDGQIQEVPYKDFKDSLQREAAWHQKQQKFAQGRKELENYYAQQFAELEKNARLVQAYEQELKGKLFAQPQPQAQAPAPSTKRNEIATLEEVQAEATKLGQSIEQKIQARDQQYQAQLAQAVQQLQQQQVTRGNALKFDQGLSKVLTSKENQILSVIPNLEKNLRFAVAETGPDSIDEAIENAGRIAKEWASNIRKNQITEQQQAQAEKAKAKLEPSDGSPVAPGKKTAKMSFLGKDGKLDHAALRRAAEALLD